MKKILTILGLVLFNIGLIYLALRLYGRTERIIRVTEAPNDIETIFFIPIMLVGLIIFVMNKTFRRFGIGLTAMCISVVIFLIFYINKSFLTEGDYESLKLKEAISIDSTFYLNIEFNTWYNSTEVTQEKCLNVDSVQVRIDKGFFRMRTMTKFVKIIENFNCTHENLDTSNLLKSYLNIGNELAKKRCFSTAIEHYSKCIELDSLCPDCYYQRGLMFMVIEKYDKALDDFMISAILKYNQLDNKEIEFMYNVKLLPYTKKIFDKINNKDFDGIGDYVHNLSTINDFDNYQKRIKFCTEKIQEK